MFLNAGNGSFRRLEFGAQASGGLLTTGDLTGDGFADLVVAQQAQVLATYAGAGDGTFAASASIGVYNSGPVLIADLNRDGRGDLVLVNSSTPAVQFLLSTASPSGLEPPLPLSPIASELVAQNNPTATCPPDPIRGTGIRLPLRWTRPATAASVLLAVEREGSPNPHLLANVVDGEFTVWQVCTFFPDTELDGWSWRIRSQDSIGNLSRWSERAQFRLAPCRLADGRPCGTIGPPLPAGQLPMGTARVAHTATLLRNGKVLITGGLGPVGASSASLQTAELYDPATRSFAPAPGMQNARAYHTATPLPDGRVLLAGGMNVARGQSPVPVAILEIYNPEDGTFRSVGTMTPRNAHTTTLLIDGRVLLAGGLPGQGSFLNTAEIFQPATHVLQPVAPMLSRRGFHTATLLADGRVAMIGGQGLNPELFVPSSNSFVGTQLMLGRINHTATRLRDGRVLVAGGLSAQGPALAGPVIFDPVAGTAVATSPMVALRTSHTAIALADGRILILGGQNIAGDSLESCEFFLPSGQSFTPGPLLTTPRTLHTATLLEDGTVLVTGGFRTSAGAQIWLGNAELIRLGQ